MGLPILPALALASGVIGTGISAIGAMQSSKAQAASANYSAQVAQNNATIAEQRAQLAAQATCLIYFVLWHRRADGGTFRSYVGEGWDFVLDIRPDDDGMVTFEIIAEPR
jgi:hypothetical protein